MIQSNELSFTYNGATSKAIDSITTTIKQGECVVLCGKSGCGKTTFTRFINGLIPEYYLGEVAGSCCVDTLTNMHSTISDYVLIVGSVFQNPRTQYFNSNTTEELAFACENIGLSSNEIKKRIDEVTNEFGIQHLLNRNVFELSGGEKQKLAFASACILNPKILVLDEPTSNLDSKSIQELSVLIQKMKEKGTTIAISEHRLYWLSNLADRYILLDHKKIKEWNKEEFLNLENREEYGLRASNISNYISILKTKKNNIASNPLLSVQDLSIGYKNKVVKEHISFSVGRGEIIGIMGHNGIGKTTLIKTLCGLIKPLKGNVKYLDKEIKQKELRQHSFLVMQDVNYQLFRDSVREEVLLGSKYPEKCDEVLNALNLLELSERHPVSLSGGQKQRVAIAASLLSGKDILYLDEPTSGLDYEHMHKVGKLLHQVKERNETVVVITHDEEFAATWCDRIIELED